MPSPEVSLTFRRAESADCRLLAQLNHQLIRDGGHRNPMNVEQLESRMRGWLDGEYAAIIFAIESEIVAYALFRETVEEIYLRQFFVATDRRRQGIGRRAIALLRSEIWPEEKRLTVEVLTHNAAAIAFWRACGYRDYCLTLEFAPPSR
jgi:predicted acetyltransferase